MTKTIDAVLLELAREIAEDNGTTADERELAWAVQQVNETILKRNAFSGVKGISLTDAERGLADYRADRRRWNVRAFEDELAAGRVRCVAFKGHSTIPDGTIIHRNMAWLVESWREAGRIVETYANEDCPLRSEHRC